jgi:hypothetical protein
MAAAMVSDDKIDGGATATIKDQCPISEIQRKQIDER